MAMMQDSVVEHKPPIESTDRSPGDYCRKYRCSVKLDDDELEELNKTFAGKAKFEGNQLCTITFINHEKMDDKAKEALWDQIETELEDNVPVYKVTIIFDKDKN
eukprot:44553_1